MKFTSTISFNQSLITGSTSFRLGDLMIATPACCIHPYGNYFLVPMLISALSTFVNQLYQTTSRLSYMTPYKMIDLTGMRTFPNTFALKR